MANEQKNGTDFDEIRDWLAQIEAAKKRDRAWREESTRYFDRYENEKDKASEEGTSPIEGAYNLLYSNTCIMQPALYSSTPKADVRRRYRDADELGKLASTALERALDYEMDPGMGYSFDDELSDTVFDMLIAGRGAARIKYEPTIETKTVQVTGEDGQPEDQSYDSVTDEAAPIEFVPWDKYRILGTPRRWNEVCAIEFEHRLTRDELVEKFGEDLGGKVPLDDLTEEQTKGLTEEQRAGLDKLRTATVHEIWDKDEKRVVFFADTLKEQYLSNEPDPLELDGFWCMPRPMYFVYTTKGMTPVPPTRLYRRQLRQLDLVTARIDKVTDAMRIRGLYASNLSELNAVSSADDNDFLPVENAAGVMSQPGGLDKAIWVWPIEKLPLVLQQLYAARDQIKQAIYEIMGISDILRGATKASETLGAQQIKAQTGSLRMSKAKDEVARFVRDCLRLKADVICSKYGEDTWAKITNMDLVTTQQRQMAGTIAQQLQAQNAPEMPPAVQTALSHPAWSDVLGLLKDDKLRCYRIDIETDSTVADQLDQDMAGLTQVLGAIGQVIQGSVPAVQSGILPVQVVQAIILSIARRARMGSDVEDSLEQAQQMQNAMPPQPPPAQAGPPGAPPQGQPPTQPPQGPPQGAPGGSAGPPAPVPPAVS